MAENRKNMKKSVIGILVLWFILFSLQGAGVIGNSITPYVGPFPFSIFFMLCMGVWGVVNAIIVVKVFSPPFYKKAFKLLEELEKKGG
ncbi:MAG: hypothetical protein J7M13_06505 [Synergistetes bacterium]|nr:hypothetical protein [Synergistota bacterium]